MKENILYAYVRDRKIIYKRPEIVTAYLQKLEGKDVNIEIKEARKEPTNEEYGYLFAVVLSCVADYIGCSKGDALEIMKQRHHFGVKEFSGELYKVPKSISKKKSDKGILAKFIGDIILDMATEGVIVPESNGKNEWWNPNEERKN